MSLHYEGPESHSYTRSAGLAPELLPYVNADKLHANRENYPELMIALSPENVRRLGVIQEVLLRIPLNHGSQEQLTVLTPAHLLDQDVQTHTYALDKSLGLDRYVFFLWGVPEWGMYGGEITLFSAAILLDPATIVTPYDIGIGGYADKGAYESLDPALRQQIQQEYFDKLLTGSDWLELIARRLLIDYTKAKRAHRNNGGDLDSFRYHYLIHAPAEWGEIKHLGEIGSDQITGYTSKATWQQYYAQLYAHGVAYQNVDYAAKGWSSTDPTPLECGIDTEQTGRFWVQNLR